MVNPKQIKNYTRRDINKKVKKQGRKGGVISPGGTFYPRNIASSRLQRATRGRLQRRDSNLHNSLTLISKGASTYKSKMDELNFKGTNIVDGRFSRKPLNAINLSHTKITGTLFTGASLANADFKASVIEDTKFNNANLLNADFKRSSLKNVEFNKANIDDTMWTGATLRACSFRENPMTRTKIHKANLTRVTFVKPSIDKNYSGVQDYKFAILECKLIGCVINDIQSTPVNIDGSSFEGCIITSSKFMSERKISEREGPVLIRSSRIHDCVFSMMDMSKTKFERPSASSVVDFNYHHQNIGVEFLQGTRFESVFFSSPSGDERDLREIMIKQGHITDCDLAGTNLNKTIIHGSRIMDSDFTGANLNEIDFRSNVIIGSNFERVQFNNARATSMRCININFKDAELQDTNLSNSVFETKMDFTGAKLQRAKFVNVINQCLPKNIIFKGADMTGTNFQSMNLQDVNFEGALLTGALFIGCDLRGTNFKNAQMTGTQFDFAELADPEDKDGPRKVADFTGANLLGSNVRVAPDWWLARGIPADLDDVGELDTHNLFYKMDMDELLNFFINKGIRGTGTLESMPMYNYIKEFFEEVIKRMTDPRDADLQKRYLDIFVRPTTEYKSRGCFVERMIGPPPFNFKLEISTTTPPVAFGTAIRYAIEYAKKQGHLFQDIYVQSVIRDSLEAHGGDGQSCPRGIIERIITYLKYPTTSEIERLENEIKEHEEEISENKGNSEIKKREEDYIESKENLIKEYKDVLSIIDSDPAGLVGIYQQNWLKEHAPDKGEQAFAKTQTPGGTQELLRTSDELKESYLNYLKDKFKIQDTFDHPKNKRLKNIILDDKEVGVNTLGVLADADMLFFGGRKYHKKNTTQKHKGKPKRKHDKHKTRSKK